MNIERFEKELPALYHNFGPDAKPAIPVPSISGQWAMTTENNILLMNFALQCLEPDEIYLEVGVLQGATLCGALWENRAKAWAVDNWSDFPPDDNQESNGQVVKRRIREYGLSDRVTLFEQDYRKFFREPHNCKVGVYFYDAEHQYVGTWDGLELAVPFLADRAIVVMDDFNWSLVREATFDWIDKHPEARMLFDLKTLTSSKTWWNGYGVVVWERNRG